VLTSIQVLIDNSKVLGFYSSLFQPPKRVQYIPKLDMTTNSPWLLGSWKHLSDLSQPTQTIIDSLLDLVQFDNRANRPWNQTHWPIVLECYRPFLPLKSFYTGIFISHDSLHVCRWHFGVIGIIGVSNNHRQDKKWLEMTRNDMLARLTCWLPLTSVTGFDVKGTSLFFMLPDVVLPTAFE